MFYNAKEDDLKIGTGNVHYITFGKGHKRLVMIPGLRLANIEGGSKPVAWFYRMFAKEYRVYMFDRKDNLKDPVTIHDLAEDTAEAMNALGIKNACVFGASQGGMIALVIAIRYHELVKKVALGSTSPHVKPWQRKVVDTWIELAKAKDREGLYQEYGKEIYPPAVYEQYKEFFNDVAKTVTDEELERFVVFAESIPDYDVSCELNRIECPVLALGAFEDPVLDSDATMEIAENLDHRPDFALFMYNGYGHAAFDTAPDYRKRVYDFFMKE